jgi:hypothetical protein
MSFKNDFPDYKSYEQNNFYYSEIPTGMSGAILGLANRFLTTADELKGMCHYIAGLIPCEPTNNWGWDWLINDFDSLLRQLAQKKFHGYMDFLAEFASGRESQERVEALNEVFAEYELGYRIDKQPGVPAIWELRTDVVLRSVALFNAQEQVKDVCEQAAEHLRKALEHLEKAGDVRARKDALRDSLSAMEALVKQLTNEAKFEDGIKKLREGSWGPDIITKDGLSIWNRIHDLYPDVRHGSPDITDLPHSEALYWIERIMLYVLYLQRVHRKAK